MTMKTTEPTLAQRKQTVIARILKNDTYLPDSGIYERVANQLAKLPEQILHNLDLLLVYRVRESNDLAIKVKEILGK